MRVLVTGGAGFIGSHIVDGLLAAGDEPYIVDDLSTGRRANLRPEVPFFEVDIRDPGQMAEVFDEVRPQAVCHQAAQMSVTLSMREPAFDAEVNIVGLLRLLENSVRTQVSRFVFASSGGALYGDVETPADEQHPQSPLSAYGISKAVGEQYLKFFARERGLSCVALRYANVYGPRQNPEGEAGVVAIFSTKLLSGERPTIFGDGSLVRDYVFVKDVAAANLLAIQKPFANAFTAINIGTGIGTTVQGLANDIRAACQQVWDRRNSHQSVPEPGYGPPRAGDLRSSLISPALARQILGWQPTVTLAAGLQETVDWFAQR